jgi:UDPglucose 6-dehydrogenase
VRVSVVGCGRRGVLQAVCLAAAGHEVVVLESDAEARRSLRAGVPPVAEPRLRRLLALALVSGRLRATGDRTAVAGSRVHVLCTGRGEVRHAPSAAAGLDDAAADAARSHAVLVALDALVPHLGPGDLVVGRERVAPGTAAWVAAGLAADGVPAGVVWVADEHRPGHAVLDTLRPARLVYGVPAGERGERATAILDALLGVQLAAGTARTTTDLATAERLGGDVAAPTPAGSGAEPAHRPVAVAGVA